MYPHVRSAVPSPPSWSCEILLQFDKHDPLWASLCKLTDLCFLYLLQNKTIDVSFIFFNSIIWRRTSRLGKKNWSARLSLKKRLQNQKPSLRCQRWNFIDCPKSVEKKFALDSSMLHWRNCGYLLFIQEEREVMKKQKMLAFQQAKAKSKRLKNAKRWKWWHLKIWRGWQLKE